VVLTNIQSCHMFHMNKYKTPHYNVSQTKLSLRITFGRSAIGGQFPWAASLQYRRKAGGRGIPLCGGALISSRHVLTAAHCDASQSGFTLSSVRLGQVDISSPVELPGVEIGVARVVSHPDFRQSPVAVMDIAIIFLERPVGLTDHIRPLCIHHPDPDLVADPPGELIVAGWGRTERASSSPLLQFTGLQPINATACQEEYNRAAAKGKLGPGITSLSLLDSQLCARGQSATDSCSGDSGGPLMAVLSGRWYLAGVVSFGTQRCDSSLPGVYTRVSSFWQWIEGVIGPL